MKQNPDQLKKQKRRRTSDLWQTGAEILPTMNQGSIPSDVLGSYTGTALDGLYPVQDADDL